VYKIKKLKDPKSCSVTERQKKVTPVSHCKFSLYRLIPFLPFLLNYSAICQLRSLDSILFHRSHAHILAGCRLETQLTSLRGFNSPVEFRIQSLRLTVYHQTFCLGVMSFETHGQYFLTLKTLIYEGTNGIKPVVTEFVT
jgi:hypothetical protein